VTDGREANRELDLAIRRRAESTKFGQLLLEEGLTAIALDAEGRLIEHCPDGTIRQVGASPPRDLPEAPSG
jgi:hypothetical protein